jgi:membrane protein implicated in regulation of membrane protease activity
VASFLAVPVTVLLVLLLAFVATMLVRAVRRHRRSDDQSSDNDLASPPLDRVNEPQLR